MKAVIKGWIKGLCRGFGYDLVTRRLSLIDFLLQYQIDTVFDVGAHIGKFGKNLRDWGYKGRIISIEPISMHFKELKKISGKDPLWNAMNIGLGSYDGKAIINVLSSMSSILKPFPIIGSTNLAEEIIVKRLDTLLGEFLKEGMNLFLKVDTQGYEREIVMGGINSLQYFRGISLELALIPLYEGQAPFAEMVSLMEKHGFRLGLIEPAGQFREKSLMLDVDCIFINEKLLLPDAYCLSS